jgi:DNA-binding MarR family transcriptional regulator
MTDPTTAMKSNATKRPADGLSPVDVALEVAPAAELGVEPAAEAEHLAFVELLFFAYRDFISDPDAVLQDYGFGRAHHRVLHFVSRQPGLRVAALLDILKITKQSLGPVLKQLVDRGFVMQTTGDADRRERRLHLTTDGRDLAGRLRSLQTSRVAAALEHARASVPTGGAADAGAAAVARAFLLGMIAANDRAGIERLLDQEAATAPRDQPFRTCPESAGQTGTQTGTQLAGRPYR